MMILSEHKSANDIVWTQLRCWYYLNTSTMHDIVRTQVAKQDDDIVWTQVWLCYCVNAIKVTDIDLNSSKMMKLSEHK